DLIGNFYKPFARTDVFAYNVIASALITLGWGYFLYQGAVDPFGGINSLWALFGISNQMLAGIALAVATTIIIKMGKAKYAWVTFVPFAWLCVTTLTAAFMKLFSSDPKIGFFAHAKPYEEAIARGEILAPATDMNVMHQIVFNDKLDAVVTMIFIAVVLLLIFNAFWTWYKILIRKENLQLMETPFVQSKWTSTSTGGKTA